MQLLYIQLAASFIIGGLVIAFQTLIAERVPPKWSGVVLTIPTTMSMGLLFIALTKSTADIPEVTVVMPAAVAIAYTFITLFSFTVRFGLWKGLALPYIVWAILAYGLTQFPPNSYTESTFIYALPIIIILYLIIRKVPDTKKLKSFPLDTKHILIRSMIGGTIILLATVLAKTAGNHWGGIFSLFPAAFSATFIIYYHLQGPEVIPSIIKSLFWPGTIGFILFGYTASLTFPEYGIWLGLLTSYLVTLTFLWIWSLGRDLLTSHS
jgi:uncharacterized membrane protein (GlpM family)